MLQAVPPLASVVLHLDIDIFRDLGMPAASFPHIEGLSWPEGQELFGGMLGDPRIRIVEVSEYATLRDLDRRCVGKLIDVLAEGLKR